MVIYLFLITTMPDTFAHLGGSLIGKHKLAPKISPNKTRDGSILITELQVPGKKKMDIKVFINGIKKEEYLGKVFK